MLKFVGGYTLDLMYVCICNTYVVRPMCCVCMFDTLTRYDMKRNFTLRYAMD